MEVKVFPLSSPDRLTSARYGGNYPASTDGRKAAWEDYFFGSSPAPRLNGVRSSVGKVMTRLLPVFRSGSSAAYSDSSPGAHSHFFHF